MVVVGIEEEEGGADGGRGAEDAEANRVQGNQNQRINCYYNQTGNIMKKHDENNRINRHVVKTESAYHLLSMHPCHDGYREVNPSAPYSFLRNSS